MEYAEKEYLVTPTLKRGKGHQWEPDISSELSFKREGWNLSKGIKELFMRDGTQAGFCRMNGSLLQEAKWGKEY